MACGGQGTLFGVKIKNIVVLIKTYTYIYKNTCTHKLYINL